MLCSTPPACPCRRRASDRAVIQGRSKAPIRKRRPSMSDKLDNPVTGKPNIAAPTAHDHGKDANSRMLVLPIILTSTFLVVDGIGSFVFNSLALLSDPGDMLTAVAALAIPLMALRIGARPADDKRTFSYSRSD